MTTTKKQLILLTLLVIGAAIIRLLDFPRIPFSLFSDEVDIGYQAMSFRETGKDYFGNFLPLQFHSFSDVRTSLPIYATILVSYLPGVSLELAIRLTPLLFSLGSLIVIYFFINSLFEHFKLEKSKEIFQPGHLAVLTLAVMPWHYTYSRTAFELSQLLFFNLFGFYLFLRYQKTNQTKNLILSFIFLSLTPIVYSTAKLAIIGYPIVLWLISDTKTRKLIIGRWYLGSLLFIPLIAIVLNGGASQRFNEIAIFTDPTIPTEVNYIRQTDLGSNLIVGSTPSLITKIIHNKITYIGGHFLNNIVKPISTTFLFSSGDPNLRHSVPGWGMLLKILIVPLIFGVYSLFHKSPRNLTLALLVWFVLAIIPSALTRDGSDHSSRLYMLILPLVILITMGWTHLSRYRYIFVVLLFVTLCESFFYFHDYFLHYPYTSELQFHFGMKEVVTMAKKENKTIVISPKYEPPLIFWLFYNHFPPAKFQSLINNKKLYHEINNDLNLEGFQIGNEPVYIASIRNQNATNLYPLKGVYFMTTLETISIYHEKQKNMTPAIKSPSGLPIFYRFEAD